MRNRSAVESVRCSFYRIFSISLFHTCEVNYPARDAVRALSETCGQLALGYSQGNAAQNPCREPLVKLNARARAILIMAICAELVLIMVLLMRR